MPEPATLPTIATQPLSLVLLARDGEAYIQGLLREWVDFLRERGTEFEVLVVDNGSTDRTAELAEAVAAEVPVLKVFRQEYPHGEGAALRTGLGAVSHPLVAYAPCHPAYPPAVLKPLLNDIDRVHLVSGYRVGRPVPWPWRLAGYLVRGFTWVVFGHASSRLPGWLGLRAHPGGWLARAFFGVRLRDAGSPLRVLRREILGRAPIQSDGIFAHIELVAKTNFATCMLDEVPVAVTGGEGPRSGGSTRQVLRDAWNVFNRPDFGPPVLNRDQPATPPAASEDRVPPPEVPPVSPLPGI